MSDRDRRRDRALGGLYDATGSGGRGKGGAGSRRGGLSSSAPTVARWLGDIRQISISCRYLAGTASDPQQPNL